MVDIRREYEGAVHVSALAGVSLSIAAGELVAILGPSGSGKSTLLGIMGLLDRPTSGRLFIDGNDMSSAEEKRRANVRSVELGFIFQNFHLIGHKTVLSNVALAAPRHFSRMARMELARESLYQVGMGHRLDFRPSQLSGGECQRVAIARATVRKPRLILADEPTGNLDTANRDVVVALLDSARSESSRTAIVLVTHDRGVAANADRVITMNEGRIEAA